MFEPAHVPSGLWWMEHERLVGLPRPGMLGEASTVFEYLAWHGVTQLFCLETECDDDFDALAGLGIGLHHVPVMDMGAPTTAQATAIGRLASVALDSGHAVAVHCRGGLGRTGTAIAAILVWRGATAETAISRVRAAQPYAVQSLVQHQFIHEFAEHLRRP
ncbi:MAG TPA: protein-tyrosine phosphatase family protein [Xanthomonadales bacterium]|nr:protein-tyrosine phosphatase family protein [Xanthomonadales bacterium]